MSSLNSYFQSELTALRELGKEFSENNPALAPFLSQKGSDPDVERLFEGFAFLTGRLRQKLDDEMPELSHSLMQMLWPNYMRPLPSCTIMKLTPDAGMTESQQVHKGTEIKAASATEGAICQFQTCHDVTLHPLAVQDLTLSQHSAAEASLNLTLEMLNQQSLDKLSLSSLRLHLAGDIATSQMLYLMLLEHVKDIQIVLRDASGKKIDSLAAKPNDLTPGGFTREESLLPYPLNTFMGYRIFQEYFYFPEAFMFIDIHRLDKLAALDETLLQQASQIEFVFRIRDLPDTNLQLSKDHIQLFCTPAVNLFSLDAMPIRLNRDDNEYKVQPTGCNDVQVGIYSVDTVQSWSQETNEQQTLPLFESFRHEEDGKETTYYSIKQRPGMQKQQVETWLRFSGFSQSSAQQKGNIISAELTCTNQNLPQQLKPGEICVPGANAPENITFSNITQPTASYPPPLQQDTQLWKVISNMSLNYLSMANIHALRTVLEAYDFASAYDTKKARRTQHLLKGLSSISHRSVDRLFQGMPVRGMETTLEVDVSCFINKGGMYLFASVLNEFFALYSSINSFHLLCVKCTEGSYYQWIPRMGEQQVL